MTDAVQHATGNNLRKAFLPIFSLMLVDSNQIPNGMMVTSPLSRSHEYHSQFVPTATRKGEPDQKKRKAK
jgi:Zn-dependent M28 family amino/carboxypeptidase